MDSLLALLPALGCVGGMLVMMLVMSSGMRSKRERPSLDESSDEIAELQHEVERLRAEVQRRDQD